MSAAELAAIWRIPVSTVRRWASEDAWPRTRTRPIRYDPDTAQDSHDRRAAGRAETLANLQLSRHRRDQVQGL